MMKPLSLQKRMPKRTFYCFSLLTAVCFVAVRAIFLSGEEADVQKLILLGGGMNLSVRVVCLLLHTTSLNSATEVCHTVHNRE